MFDIVCQNIKNDLAALDACVKELRRCELEGKTLYAKCAMSLNFTKDIDDELKKRGGEVKALADQLNQPSVKITKIKT